MSLFTRIFKNLSLKAVIPSFVLNSKETIINSKTGTPITPIESISIFINRYHDSSLPTEFHRSYVISMTPKKFSILISYYINILPNKSLLLIKTEYQSFTKALLELDIKNREEVKSNGCAGGTSYELNTYIYKNYAVKGYIHYCGGESFGNLEGDVAKAVELFKAIVPNLNNRINASKK